MESNFNRYGTFVGAVGCLFGICLMYPGSLQAITIVQHKTQESLGFLSYEKTDVQFLKKGHSATQGYEFKSYIPDSLITKIVGLGITILSAQVCRSLAETAQRECYECETRENIEKLTQLAIFQQKQEALAYIEAKKYELDQSITFRQYQEQKRQELLRLITQNPHESEDIDSLYYQIQEGFYDQEQPMTHPPNVPENTVDMAPDSQLGNNLEPTDSPGQSPLSESLSDSVSKPSAFCWSVRSVHQHYPDTTPEELFRLLSASAEKGDSPREFIRKVLKCTEGQEHATRSYTRHGKTLFKWLIDNYDDGTLSAKFKDFLIDC